MHWSAGPGVPDGHPPQTQHPWIGVGVPVCVPVAVAVPVGDGVGVLVGVAVGVSDAVVVGSCPALPQPSPLHESLPSKETSAHPAQSD